MCIKDVKHQLLQHFLTGKLDLKKKVWFETLALEEFKAFKKDPFLSTLKKFKIDVTEKAASLVSLK